MKAPHVVGAHYGTVSWISQRVSAVFISFYVFLFFFFLFSLPVFDFFSWRSLFSPFWFQATTFLFFVSLCAHAWVGVRDILMDYIKPLILRLFLQVLVIFLLIVDLFWALKILRGVF